MADNSVWDDRPSSTVTHYSARFGEAFVSGRELKTGNDNDVLSFTWNKNIDAPTGKLSLRLVVRQNYLFGPNRILPNDVLTVETDAGDGSPSRVISHVLVDRVSLLDTVDNKGGLHREIAVSCSDAGKVLEETSLILDPSIERFIPGNTREVRLGFALLNRALQHSVNNAIAPNQLVVDIFKLVLDVSVAQFRLPGSDTNFARLIGFDHVQRSMVGAAIVTNLFGLEANTKLWSLMKQYSNEPFNELFVDVRDEAPDYLQNTFEAVAQDLISNRVADGEVVVPGLGGSGGPILPLQADDGLVSDLAARSKLKLVMRQRPYDLDSFNALPAVVVFRTEVTHTDIGYASHEVFNMFRVWGIVAGGAFLPEGRLLRTNPESIGRHGPKRMEPETIYVFNSVDEASKQATGTAGAGSAGMEEMLRLYTDITSVWNALNEEFFAGTVTIRYRPDIRVGMRFVLKDADGFRLEAYIQSVTQNYNASPTVQSTTSVTVVRGILYDSDGNMSLSNSLRLRGGATQKLLADLGFVDNDSLDVFQQVVR